VERHTTPALAQLAFLTQVGRLEAKGYLAGRSHPEMIRAIQARPQRREAYLVYADWLVAQGDPRGELIVTMALERDVEPLFREHEAQLRPVWMQGMKLEWRLGFLRKVTAPANDCWRVRRLLRHPSALALEELVLEDATWALPETWFQVLQARPPTLRHIEASRNSSLIDLTARVPGLVASR
jgi:uncharacterized protein (TIGR02996 family)